MLRKKIRICYKFKLDMLSSVSSHIHSRIAVHTFAHVAFLALALGIVVWHSVHSNDCIHVRVIPDKGVPIRMVTLSGERVGSSQPKLE
jgi:hypothetical protein